MKLKDGFLLHKTGEETLVVASGPAAAVFNGLIRNNSTAGFILEQLQQTTTEEAIVDAMEARYDAPQAQIAADVHRMVERLRAEGFLDE